MVCSAIPVTQQSRWHLDVICLVNGNLFVGEAKSNDEISAEQISFYEEVGRRVVIDGLVFATSQRDWKLGTKTRIEQLKTRFTGEVISLTDRELYPGITENGEPQHSRIVVN